VLVDVGKHDDVECAVGEVELVGRARVELDSLGRALRLVERGIDPDPVEAGEGRVAVGRPAVLATDIEPALCVLRRVGADQVGQRLGEDAITDLPLLVGLKEGVAGRRAQGESPDLAADDEVRTSERP
jgi:hypothetical protein